MIRRTNVILGLCHLALLCICCSELGVDEPTDQRTFLGLFTSEVATLHYPGEQVDSVAVVFAVKVWEDCCNGSRRFHAVDFHANGDTLILHPLDSVFSVQDPDICDTVACTRTYNAAHTFFTIGTRVLAVLQQDSSDTVFDRGTMEIVPDSADTTMQALSIDDLPTHTPYTP